MITWRVGLINAESDLEKVAKERYIKMLVIMMNQWYIVVQMQFTSNSFSNLINYIIFHFQFKTSFNSFGHFTPFFSLFIGPFSLAYELEQSI